jgi:hypothetical protein
MPCETAVKLCVKESPCTMQYSFLFQIVQDVSSFCVLLSVLALDGSVSRFFFNAQKPNFLQAHYTASLSELFHHRIP